MNEVAFQEDDMNEIHKESEGVRAGSIGPGDLTNPI